MGIQLSDRDSLPNSKTEDTKTEVASGPQGIAQPRRASPGQMHLASFSPGGATGVNVDPKNDVLNLGMTLVSLDPALKGTIDKMVRTNKVEFVVVDDVSKVAQEAGAKGFKGDAFTAIGQVLDPNGNVKATKAIVYVERSTLSSIGKTVVALQHEMYHIKRAVEGKRDSNYNKEELETFKLSVAGAQRLVQKISSMASDVSDVNQRGAMLRTVADMKEQIEIDKKALEIYRKRSGG